MLCLIFVSCQHSRFFLNQDLERWKIDGQTLVVFFRTFIILERCAKGLVILRCHPRPNETHVRFVWHLYASPTLYDHYPGVNSCCLACLSRSRSWYYRQPFKHENPFCTFRCTSDIVFSFSPIPVHSSTKNEPHLPIKYVTKHNLFRLCAIKAQQKLSHLVDLTALL